ncbi:hypothetical protein [Aureimonas altamirensis]|uniref:hypothetical protein n=1 Tax=Aureimonas altamirensis TaxID=370622 RepID=UPI0025527DE4|nr:hypothetical protein [Aureimonas altamirensis]
MPAVGGKRPGAGRPKGVPNKATDKRQAEIAASGLTPLDFMIAMLRDETASLEDRKWGAEKAAPFVHPRLQAIQHSGDGGGPVQFSRVDFVIRDSKGDDDAD